MNALRLLLALMVAIPTLKEWFDQLVAEYIRSQIETMKAENREAIREAFETHDQRPIEKVIGSEKAGEPSGLPGTEFRDHLPNMPDFERMQDDNQGRDQRHHLA